MKEAPEVSGSLALAGNELLEQRLELGQLLVGQRQAQIYNPCIRGWVSYYGHFHKTQLRLTLNRIDEGTGERAASQQFPGTVENAIKDRKQAVTRGCVSTLRLCEGHDEGPI